MQQFANTVGKNATDSALIIDAMDLIYTGRFQAFCIVSSDSDFTRLASRIREDGVTVYGFGERKTLGAFRNACDRFTYLDVLDEATTAGRTSPPSVPSSASSAPTSTPATGVTRSCRTSCARSASSRSARAPAAACA